MIEFNPVNASQKVKHRLFKIAKKNGYCSQYSSSDEIIAAVRRVANEMNLTNIHPQEDIDYVEA